jgi:hypothetical protein
MEKWMSMPSLGEAMVNAFKNRVLFFSPHSSQTWLPSFCPQNNPPIFFAHVTFKMKDLLYFLAPGILKDWKESANPEVLKWEDKYSSWFTLNVGQKRLFSNVTHY